MKNNGETGSVICRLLMVCLVMAICATGLQAQTQSGDATIAAEATIYENEADDNGGGYTRVCVGNHATTGTTRRAYVRYILPTIPAGSTVTRVRLTFTQVRVRSMGSGSPKTATLQLRRVTSSWTEGSGGASNAACGGGTNVSGIDWTGAPSNSGADSGTEALPATNDVTITFDTDVGTNDDGLISDVQAWVDDDTSNHGWRLRISEESTVDNARLLSPGSLTVYWSESFCNINMVSGVTEFADASYEACEILVVGPSFIAKDGASISLSSGWEIWFEPDFLIEQGATLNANVCGQSLCIINAFPMPYGCHSCINQICDIDPTCCSVAFDQACLDKVNTICGLICE